MAQITAPTGLPADIQEAVDQASINDTVLVAGGTFDWDGTVQVEVPAGVNVMSAGTVLRHNTPAPWVKPFMFNVTGSGIANRRTRISGFQFKGLVSGSDDVQNGSAVGVADAIDYRIDHCRFTDFPNTAIGVGGYGGCRGVIDHNTIENPYKTTVGGAWGYGIIVSCNDYWDWDSDITHFLGKYDTIPSLFPTAYVEDNIFNLTRHSIASNQLGWYVFRHNTAYQEWNSAVDVHGSGDIGAGGRGAEVYENTITSPVGIGFRGGSGVIYNNHAGSVWVLKDIPGTLLRPMDNLFIWNLGTDTFTNYDNQQVENVNFFLRAPNQAQDGFTYTPYPYPHPLTLDTQGVIAVNSSVPNARFTVARL